MTRSTTQTPTRRRPRPAAAAVSQMPAAHPRPSTSVPSATRPRRRLCPSRTTDTPSPSASRKLLLCKSSATRASTMDRAVCLVVQRRTTTQDGVQNIFIMGGAQFCTKCHVFMNLQIRSQVKESTTVSHSLDGCNACTDAHPLEWCESTSGEGAPPYKHKACQKTLQAPKTHHSGKKSFPE